MQDESNIDIIRALVDIIEEFAEEKDGTLVSKVDQGERLGVEDAYWLRKGNAAVKEHEDAERLNNDQRH